MAITYGNIGLAEPSTITKVVASVVVARGSTNEHQEILVIGDPQTSLNLATVTDTTPASSAMGLVTRIAGTVPTSGDSTVVQGTSPWITAGNSTVFQGGAPWTISGNSTVVIASGNSSVTITAIAAGAGRLNIGSTAADNAVLVSGNSTVAPLAGSVWVVGGASTVAASSNSSGLYVRPVVAAMQAFASTSALASTSLAITSSGAGLRAYVCGYTITSTNQTPAHWGFYSSNGTLLWPFTLAALSSAVAGANLAVSPPGYLFRTAAAEALNFKTNGSTVSGVQLGVSYWLDA